MNRDDRSDARAQSTANTVIKEIDSAIQRGFDSYVKNGAAKKGFFQSLRDAFSAAAETTDEKSFRHDADIKNVEDLKYLLINDLQTKDNANLLLRIMMNHKKARVGFFSQATDKELVTMAIIAKIAKDEHLYETICHALNTEAVNIDRHAAAFFEELDNGTKGRFAAISTKAFHQVARHFDIDDYKKLNHFLQSVVAGQFARHIQSHGLKKFKVAHRRAIQAFELPEALKDIHKNTLDYLQRRIITDPELASKYRIFRSNTFDDLPEQTRVALADFHMDNLSKLYGTQKPAIIVHEADDESSMSLALSVRGNLLGDIQDLQPVLFINKRVENGGMKLKDGLRYLNSVSHEFAHLMEKSFQMGITDMHDGNMAKKKDKHNFPEIPVRSKLHSVARLFNINATYDGIRTHDTYVSSGDDREIYFNQLNERHAYWYGSYCEAKIDQALRALDYIHQPELYKVEAMAALSTISLYFLTAGPKFNHLTQTTAGIAQKIGQIENGRLQDYFMPTEIKLAEMHIERLREDDTLLPEHKQLLGDAQMLCKAMITNMTFIDKVVQEWLPAGAEFERDDTRFREQLFPETKPKP